MLAFSVILESLPRLAVHDAVLLHGVPAAGGAARRGYLILDGVELGHVVGIGRVGVQLFPGHLPGPSIDPGLVEFPLAAEHSAEETLLMRPFLPEIGVQVVIAQGPFLHSCPRQDLPVGLAPVRVLPAAVPLGLHGAR